MIQTSRHRLAKEPTSYVAPPTISAVDDDDDVYELTVNRLPRVAIRFRVAERGLSTCTGQIVPMLDCHDSPTHCTHEQADNIEMMPELTGLELRSYWMRGDGHTVLTAEPNTLRKLVESTLIPFDERFFDARCTTCGGEAA